MNRYTTRFVYITVAPNHNYTIATLGYFPKVAYSNFATHYPTSPPTTLRIHGRLSCTHFRTF